MNMRNGSGKERGRRYTVHKIIKIDREVEKIDIELQVRDTGTLGQSNEIFYLHFSVVESVGANDQQVKIFFHFG